MGLFTPDGGTTGGGTTYQAMVRFFREDNWNFKEADGKPFLTMGFKGEKGRWNVVAQARDDQEQIVIYSVLDQNVPEDKRPAMSECISRANYGLYIGNFEMDINDGEVRYKTIIDGRGWGQTIPSEAIKRAVYTNMIMMDKYYPGIMATVFGNVSPAQAIKDVEG